MSVRGVGLAKVSACTSDAIVVVVKAKIQKCYTHVSHETTTIGYNPKLRAEVTGGGNLGQPF